MTYYVLQTSPRKERAIGRGLHRSGHDVYMAAIVRRSRPHAQGGRRKIIPLFPGYLFIKAPDAALVPLWMHAIRHVKGARGFLATNRERSASTIDDEKIETLKQQMKLYVKSEKERRDNSVIREGMDATLKSGPGAGKTGLITWTSSGRARILIWLFGAQREITVKKTNLEAA